MSAITYTGQLARNAQARFSVDGTAWLCVELATAGVLVCAARRELGATPSAAIAAHRQAASMRAGDLVTIHAGKSRIAYRPTPHVVLDDVDMIMLHPTAAPRHEPHQERAA